MGWEALEAVGTFGQFVVVLGAAFFGYAQLKASRRQTELQATIPYFAYTRSPEFLDAFQLVRAAAAGATELDGLAEALAAADLGDTRVKKLFNLANFFNELGVLVQEEMIDEQIALPFFAWQVIATWDLFVPYVLNRRRAGVVAMMVGFESLVVRARGIPTDARVARARSRLPLRLRNRFDESLSHTMPVTARHD